MKVSKKADLRTAVARAVSFTANFDDARLGELLVAALHGRSFQLNPVEVRDLASVFTSERA